VGHLISHVRDQKVKREDIANGIVNDTTQFQTKNRPYLSNEYLEFHTDLCDVTGLLCVHPSPKGGENKVVSSIAVFEELNTHFPRMAKALSTPLQLMHQTPDMPDGKNHPILHAPFSECQGYFSSFMLGSYIRTTYERRGLDLDPMVLDAIDKVQEISNNDNNAIQFKLSQGDILFTNNHITYHSRNAFEDTLDQPPRHLMRIWLSTFNNRPLSSSYNHLYGANRLAAGSMRGGFELLT